MLVATNISLTVPEAIAYFPNVDLSTYISVIYSQENFNPTTGVTSRTYYNSTSCSNTLTSELIPLFSDF